MNASFTEIGVGFYRSAAGTNYWTQLFIVNPAGGALVIALEKREGAGEIHRKSIQNVGKYIRRKGWDYAAERACCSESRRRSFRFTLMLQSSYASNSLKHPRIQGRNAKSTETAAFIPIFSFCLDCPPFHPLDWFYNRLANNAGAKLPNRGRAVSLRALRI